MANHFTNRKDWPKTCPDAISEIVSKMDPESINLVIQTKFDDLIKFHRLWGMRIRNDYGLCRGNTKLMNSCLSLRENGQFDPDIVSMIIIEEVWKELQKYKRQ
jgi:hypothetical protein